MVLARNAINCCTISIERQVGRGFCKSRSRLAERFSRQIAGIRITKQYPVEYIHNYGISHNDINESHSNAVITLIQPDVTSMTSPPWRHQMIQLLTIVWLYECYTGENLDNYCSFLKWVSTYSIPSFIGLLIHYATFLCMIYTRQVFLHLSSSEMSSLEVNNNSNKVELLLSALRGTVNPVFVDDVTLEVTDSGSAYTFSSFWLSYLLPLVSPLSFLMFLLNMLRARPFLFALFNTQSND